MMRFSPAQLVVPLMLATGLFCGPSPKSTTSSDASMPMDTVPVTSTADMGNGSQEPVQTGYCPDTPQWTGRKICHSDDDCDGKNEVCDAGRCETGCPGPCDHPDGLPCGPAQICVAGECQPLPCTVDGDCPCGSCVHLGCWPRPWVCVQQ